MKVKKVKKSKALIVAIAMILVILSTIIISLLTPKSYALTTDDGKFDYYIDSTNMTALIVSCNNVGDGDGDVIVPSSIGNYTVTEIISEVFTGSWIETIHIPSSVTSISADVVDDCINLKSINVNEQNANYSSVDGVLFNKDKTTILSYPQGKQETGYEIPDSVTNISTATFDKCQNLINVNIPNTVTNIGTEAFAYCTKLENIELPSQLNKIEKNLFDGCTNLKTINIPNGVSSIEAKAFNNCSSLTSITVPASVSNIGEDVFLNCNALKDIIVDENNLKYISENGVLFYKNKTLLIKYPAGKAETSYTIPEEVKTIEKNAFYYSKNLNNIIIPEGVTSIGKEAFIACLNLKNITIPDSVTSLGNGVFEHCASLEDVTISGNGLPISDECFMYCGSLKSIDLPYGVSSIGYFAFYNCPSLANATIRRSGAFLETTAFQKSEKLTLYSYAGGNVEEYANEYEIPFVELEDTNPPKINNVSGNVAEWTTEQITLVVWAQDNETGINSYSFDNGETWQTSNVKTYTENTSEIIIKVKDNAGNIATYNQTINIDKIDRTAPIINTVTGNATEWTNEDVTITINAIDSQSGIASENAYSFDNGYTWQTSNTKTYTENASGIKIKVKDALGTVVTYKETINIDKIDKTVPTITVSPNGASTSKKKNITITVADIGGSGLNSNNSYQYQLGTSNTEVPTDTWEDYTSGTEFTIGEELTGEYYLWIKVLSDNAGNKSSESEYMVSNKFTFDNTEELVISSEVYAIDGNSFITNISPKTNVATLLQNLTCNYEIKVYNKNNEEVTGQTLVGTGMKIVTNSLKYILVVKGDVNGSGTVDLNDAIKVLQHRAGGPNPQLTGAYLKAAQLTKEGQVTLNDVIKIMRYKATNGKEGL